MGSPPAHHRQGLCARRSTARPGDVRAVGAFARREDFGQQCDADRRAEVRENGMGTESPKRPPHGLKII